MWSFTAKKWVTALFLLHCQRTTWFFAQSSQSFLPIDTEEVEEPRLGDRSRTGEAGRSSGFHHYLRRPCDAEYRQAEPQNKEADVAPTGASGDGITRKRGSGNCLFKDCFCVDTLCGSCLRCCLERGTVDVKFLRVLNASADLDDDGWLFQDGKRPNVLITVKQWEWILDYRKSVNTKGCDFIWKNFYAAFYVVASERFVVVVVFFFTAKEGEMNCMTTLDDYNLLILYSLQIVNSWTEGQMSDRKSLRLFCVCVS